MSKDARTEEPDEEQPVSEETVEAPAEQGIVVCKECKAEHAATECCPG
jgi:hypothetical protein